MYEVCPSNPASAVVLFLVNFHLVLFRNKVNIVNSWYCCRPQNYEHMNCQGWTHPGVPRVPIAATQGTCVLTWCDTAVTQPHWDHHSVCFWPWTQTLPQENLKNFWSHPEINYWLKEFPITNCGVLRIPSIWPHTSIIPPKPYPVVNTPCLI